MEANVILLQVVFVLVILGVFAMLVHFTEERITRVMVENISTLLESGGTMDADVVLKARAEARSNEFLGVFLVASVIAGTFGYLLSLITLRPARSALASQKQFVGNIAHELRTPLSVIKTNIEVALMDDGLDPKMQEMLSSNIEELNRTSDIINNLLTLNTFVRTERMEFDNIDLGVIVDGTTKKLASLARTKNIEMTVRKSEFRTVVGNATALEQVVTNLVKNALNYTPENGHVSISIAPDYQGYVRLTIVDNGVGIEQNDLFRIFEPFFRADRSRNRGRGSSGLGLAIVSEIVKLHRGTITIKSAPHKGTTAILSLPCGKTFEDAEEHPATNPSLGEISVDFSQNHKSS